MDQFVLELPAAPQYVGSARLFVAAVARRLDCSPETVDDLKLGISEACTQALAAGGLTPQRLRLTVARVDARLELEVVRLGREASAEVDDPATAEAHQIRDLGLDLLRSLFPDTGQNGSAISFSTPIG